MKSSRSNAFGARLRLFVFTALAFAAASALQPLRVHAATAYVLTVKSALASGVTITTKPADNNAKTSGTTTFTLSYDSGTSVVLTAPPKAGTNVFSEWTGCSSASTLACTVTMGADTTVTAIYVLPPKVKPTAALVISPTAITALQTLEVRATVAAPSGDPVPAGSVILSSGKYVSPAGTLANGVVYFTIPKGSLAIGTDSLVATYTPSSADATTYSSTSADISVKVSRITPTVGITYSPDGITTAQALAVKVAIVAPTGDPIPAGTVKLTSGKYTSAVVTLGNGDATIGIPAGTLPAGTESLIASYTPSAADASTYSTVTGTATVKVTAAVKLTPAVAVTTSAATIGTQQSLTVKAVVSGATGDPVPAGTVIFSSGSYTSAAVTLANGAATLAIPGGTLAAGSDIFKASYTPAGASIAIYDAATGVSPAVAVFAQSLITVNPANPGPAISDKLLGMNMATWYDQSTPQIVGAFQTAGIKAIRWPGGSSSDIYHWETNSICNDGYTVPADSFPSPLVSELWAPANLDVAITANYGTNTACNGPGEPSEAAAWVTSALKNGNYVSHWTIGNEVYGSWETDMHTVKNDPTTYANAVATGYYPQMKAANANTLVGVVVEPHNNPPWDPIVMAKAKYDFVEYHYYAQTPGQESDTYLVHQAALDLTTNINAIKADLAQYGKADTPIYVGEIGSVYTNPGKQSTSITQALYAGQVLGELMNDGVTRATWWIGFGGCSDASSGNFSSSLYGWQTYGGYMVFSDGLPEYGCEGAPSVAAGVLLPTARAFQLFSQIAVSGENVLPATVAGDTTDVRAYAATSSGGTALLLFNDNETANEAVLVRLGAQTTASSVTVTTYDKAIYDQSKTGVWAPPTTTSLGAKPLPLTLTLAPWSMNVVIVK